jgi:ABC-type Na+ transport system ATPase subunit NatA
MKYKQFRIKNFKGIKDATVDLEAIAGASVFAFVGLNESGKTTVLEAIHSFSPDDATSELLAGAKEVGVPIKDRVPRHQISSFTGDVSVSATLSVDQSDKHNIISAAFAELSLHINPAAFPAEIVFERQQRFKDGDFQGSYFTLRSNIQVKGIKQKKWRTPSGDELHKIKILMYGYTPDISYFPTFVFNFPERIYLTDRGKPLDRFYRSVFQDILDFDGKGYTIEKDITRRLRSSDLITTWIDFLATWAKRDDEAKIQHVMDRASSTVTTTVFGRWNKIFGEDARGKEIVITFGLDEGQVQDSKGTITKTQEHDLFIQFKVRDGTRRFGVNDRSLGFRWFFAFMLFTQFRVARSTTRPLLFLFDEPASNLHAAAQQKLIDCFPEIAKGKHALAYTTHSHYMIEPKWLEQTYIVTNRSDSPALSVLEGLSLDDESLDIQVSSYRSFVNDNPGKTSYFQPILDRLEVVPSRLDLQRSAVILEGRSDYYILRYASKLLGMRELPLMPGMGAGTFGALAAINVGWNLGFLFVLDGDKQGESEKKRYALDYGLPLTTVVTLSKIVPSVHVIEDTLDDEAKAIISQRIGIKNAPSKAQIKRYFQESLASDRTEALGSGFSESTRTVLEVLSERIGR